MNNNNKPNRAEYRAMLTPAAQSNLPLDETKLNASRSNVMRVHIFWCNF